MHLGTSSVKKVCSNLLTSKSKPSRGTRLRQLQTIVSFALKSKTSKLYLYKYHKVRFAKLLISSRVSNTLITNVVIVHAVHFAITLILQFLFLYTCTTSKSAELCAN